MQALLRWWFLVAAASPRRNRRRPFHNLPTRRSWIFQLLSLRFIILKYRSLPLNWFFAMPIILFLFFLRFHQTFDMFSQYFVVEFNCFKKRAGLAAIVLDSPHKILVLLYAALSNLSPIPYFFKPLLTAQHRHYACILFLWNIFQIVPIWIKPDLVQSLPDFAMAIQKLF